jgi:excinuclease ABC subunit B
MQVAIDETQRRRELQQAYNTLHGITPETVRKEIRSGIEAESSARARAFEAVGQGEEGRRQSAEILEQLEADMMQAAAELDFERAAAIRDRISGMRGEGSGGSPRRAGGRGRKGGSGGSSAGRIPRPKR